MSPSDVTVSGVANFSRSLAASASGFIVPTAPISTTILPAAAWSFFTTSACTSSRSSHRGRRSMRPVHPFHRHHPLAGEVPEHLRHLHVLAQHRGVHVCRRLVHRLRLDPEVHLP